MRASRPGSLTAQLKEALGLMKNPDDWSKRAKGMQMIRNICTSASEQNELELVTEISKMEVALLDAIKDLRSQVCKEASRTICVLAEKFGCQLLKMFEVLLPCCMALLPNCAKIMSISGAEAADTIIKYVESPKLILTVTSYAAHKAKEIRRQTQKLVVAMLDGWNPATIGSNISNIVECIKAGINDADSVVRENARSCFLQLEANFPQEANFLWETLDRKRQKDLGSTSAGSSALSLVTQKSSVPTSKPVFTVRRTASLMNMAKSSAKKTPIHKTPLRVPPAPSWTDRAKAGMFPANVVPHFEAKIVNDVINCYSDSDEENFLDESYDVRHAINLVNSTDTNEKLRGVNLFQALFKSHRPLPDSACNEIFDVLSKMMFEGNHKIIGRVCEVLVEFLRFYDRQIKDIIASLMIKTICKRSSELIPKTQVSLDSVIEAVNLSMPAHEQFLTLCGFIAGSHFMIQAPKARDLIINCLSKLLPQVSYGTTLDRDDVKGTISKILQIVDDPSSSHLLEIVRGMVGQLYDVNPGEFIRILEALPSGMAEFAYQELERRRCSSHPLDDPADGVSVVCPPALLLGELTLEDTSTMSSFMDHLDSTEPSFSAEDAAFFAKNCGGECHKIRELLDVLENNRSEIEQCDALKKISDIVETGSLIGWDDYFPTLLLKVFDGLRDSRLNITSQALKLLSKLCLAQPSCLNDQAENVLLEVIATAHNLDSDNKLWFSQSHRDCLATLATHLPTDVVIVVAQRTLAEKDDNRLISGLVLTANLAKSFCDKPLEERFIELVPTVVKAYSNERTSVRKWSIFTLVELIVSCGRLKLEPFLDNLGKGRKILEKYLADRLIKNDDFIAD